MHHNLPTEYSFNCLVRPFWINWLKIYLIKKCKFSHRCSGGEKEEGERDFDDECGNYTESRIKLKYFFSVSDPDPHGSACFCLVLIRINFRIRAKKERNESGLGSQDILTEKPWKLKKKEKKCWHHFYIRGKRQRMFFVLIIRFRQFGAEKMFIFFSIFF